MWISFAFWPSFIATLISAALVYLVISANIKKPGNMAAFVMFISMLIWSFGELIERLAGPPPNNPNLHYLGVLSLNFGPYDANLAYMGAIILCFGIFLLPAGIIHFALDYPFRLKLNPNVRKGVLYGVYGFSFAAMVVNLFNQYVGYLTVAYMKPYKAMGVWLWGLESGPIHALFSLWMMISAIIMLIILILKLRNLRMEIVKKQIIITVIGFFITLVILTVTALIPMVLERKDTYPLTTLGFSIFGIFVMYTIAKYRLFLVVPTTETVEEEEELPDEGIYMMDPEEAYNKFSLLARSGYSAIGFVVPPVEEFKKKYKLVNTPLFRITKSPGKDKLNPEISEHREMISFIIMSMLEQVYKPVILMDLSADWISDKTKTEILKTIKETSKEIGGVFLVTGVAQEEPKKEDEE
ncbi:MAG: hypothetical protein GXO25_03540 [Euryarchaeota archaeon]|nr:hypothetical protein [Euryarchaeota archaeon]